MLGIYDSAECPVGIERFGERSGSGAVFGGFPGGVQPRGGFPLGNYIDDSL